MLNEQRPSTLVRIDREMLGAMVKLNAEFLKFSIIRPLTISGVLRIYVFNCKYVVGNLKLALILFCTNRTVHT
jgi:hypothetical protein